MSKFYKHYEELFKIYNKCNLTKLNEMIPLVEKTNEYLEWKQAEDDPEIMMCYIYDMCYINQYPDSDYYMPSNGAIFYYLDIGDILPNIQEEFTNEIIIERSLSKHKRLIPEIAKLICEYI